MTVQLIEITEDVADRMQVLTTPTASQVGDARMIIIDLLGSEPSWPLAVLVDHVCTAYEAPDGVGSLECSLCGYPWQSPKAR